MINSFLLIIILTLTIALKLALLGYHQLSVISVKYFVHKHLWHGLAAMVQECSWFMLSRQRLKLPMGALRANDSTHRTIHIQCGSLPALPVLWLSQSWCLTMSVKQNSFEDGNRLSSLVQNLCPVASSHESEGNTTKFKK